MGKKPENIRTPPVEFKPKGKPTGGGRQGPGHVRGIAHAGPRKGG
jgi:hypothetical protein